MKLRKHEVKLSRIWKAYQDMKITTQAKFLLPSRTVQTWKFFIFHQDNPSLKGHYKLKVIPLFCNLLLKLFLSWTICSTSNNNSFQIFVLPQLLRSLCSNGTSVLHTGCRFLMPSHWKLYLFPLNWQLPVDRIFIFYFSIIQI